MKSTIFAVAILALIAGARAAAYSTVVAAVKALPELSTLGSNLGAAPISSTLSDPNFVGTVFLPTDASLAALSAQVGGDFSSLLASNPDQANAVFSYNVVPGAALTTAALKDGMTLKTASGETLAVTVKSGTVYINGVPITKANIAAGKAVVHETGGALLPPDLADVLAASAGSTGADATDPFADLTASSTTVDAAAADAATAADGAASKGGAGEVVSADADETAPAATSAAAAAASPSTASSAATDTTVPADQRSGAGQAAVSLMTAAALAVPLLFAALA